MWNSSSPSIQSTSGFSGRYIPIHPTNAHAYWGSQPSGSGSTEPTQLAPHPPQALNESTNLAVSKAALQPTSSHPVRSVQGSASPPVARIAASYVEIRSKRSSDVYKIEKLYVGLLRELPPPVVVQKKWDQDVRTDLENHLCQAASMLSKSMRDEDVIIEPVLCMAGKKCSPDVVTMPAGQASPKDPVMLKPTVWIHCGSKKCKKKVLGVVQKLAYLNHFLLRFSMEPPYASLQAPWPAAGENDETKMLREVTEMQTSFEIEWPSATAGAGQTVCGLRARFVVRTSSHVFERYSTVGGLVYVDGHLYGLTSAHGIVSSRVDDASSDTSPGTDSGDENSSLASSEPDSVSDSGSGSLSASHSDFSHPAQPAVPGAGKERQTFEKDSPLWMELELPRILAYIGNGTTVGDYSFPSYSTETSDFALIEFGSLPVGPNEALDLEQHMMEISDHIATSNLVEGEVDVVVVSGSSSLKGYLLSGEASLIVRGTVMRTKKIQVGCPGAAGLSGAWVIRKGKLCGSIYAAYDRSPYLHMLPAEGIFRDISRLLYGSTVRAGGIRVASREDVLSRRLETEGTQDDSSSMQHPSVALSRGNHSQVTPSGQSSQVSIEAVDQKPHNPRFTLAVPAGRVSITIHEARGLSPSKSPYFVCQFQGAEYISKESTAPAQEYEAASYDVGTGLIRGGNNNALAIPMRNRRTSSSSAHDQINSQPRWGSIVPETSNPRWDANFECDRFGPNPYLNMGIYTAQGPVLLSHAKLKMSTNDCDYDWVPLDSPEAEICVTFQTIAHNQTPVNAQDFQVEKLIGKGSNGQVYQVRKKDTGRFYAMKVVSKKDVDEREAIQALHQRIAVKSPFVVEPRFAFETPAGLHLLSDYKAGGELFWHLQREGRFQERRAKFYIAEMILGLQEFHAHGLVLRSFKPETMLLDAFGHISMCDNYVFDRSPIRTKDESPFAGIMEYLAPEDLEGGVTRTGNYWSLGVLTFEMCCGWSPFYAEDTQQMHKNIVSGKVRFPRDALSTEGRNFVKGLLNRNAAQRLGQTPEEVKRHPFFSDIDWEALAQKEVDPPIVPKLKTELIKRSDSSSSLNKRAEALANPLSGHTLVDDPSTFAGFTFVDDSAAEFKGFTFVDDSVYENDFRSDGEVVRDDLEEEVWGQPKVRSDRMTGVIPPDVDLFHDDII